MTHEEAKAVVEQAMYDSEMEDRTVDLPYSREVALELLMECEDDDAVADYWGPGWRIHLTGEQA